MDHSDCGPEGKPKANQPQTRDQRRILVADDDAEMRALLAVVLEYEGHEVVECTDGTHLLEYLQALGSPTPALPVDLMICDMRLPGLTGLDVLEQMGGRPGVPPMILITAFGSDCLHRRARQLGVSASLDKPFEIDQLMKLVHDSLPVDPCLHRDQPS